jgi:ankyrin repeat protein
MRRPQASTLANCNGAASVQQVLDTVLGWSALNHHFDVAGFLFEHGGDINTNWNSHEPASILHTLVFEDDYEAMRFLIDRQALPLGRHCTRLGALTYHVWKG